MARDDKLYVDSGLIRFFGDGSACILVSEDGRPGGEAMLPAPGKSEAEIHEAVEEAKKSYWIEGYYIDHTRRVKNLVFDSNRERTTTIITFRSCRNDAEAEYVLQKAKEIIEEWHGNEKDRQGGK
jgi:hypothetical protein